MSSTASMALIGRSRCRTGWDATIHLWRSLLAAIASLTLLAACHQVPGSDPAIASAQANGAMQAKQPRPNVLIIIPDQLRRYSAGYWSQAPYRQHVQGEPDPVVTPNLDQLARNGVVFTRGISNYPLCSPYRGMLLTGTYPARSGLPTNARRDRDVTLNLDIANIVDVFNAAQYETAYFGKTHWARPLPHFDAQGNYVGTEEAPGGHFMNRYDSYVPPGPNRLGIDYFFHTVIDNHYRYKAYSNDPALVGGRADGQFFQPFEYSTRVEARHLSAYIENHRSQRDGAQPFFAIWSPNPPHGPTNDDSIERHVRDAHYSEDLVPEITQLLVRDNADTEAGGFVRNYFAHVTSVDSYIGEVIATLRREGLLDNTIILISSDHGEMMGSHGLRAKNVIYAEATGVPLIVHWPAGLGPGINTMPFNVPDVMPTLLGLAGLGEAIPPSVQGRNFAGNLTGSGDTAAPNLHSLIIVPESRGVDAGRYTLIVDGTNAQAGRVFLFDNFRDPYQLDPIAREALPNESAALLQDLAHLLVDTEDSWAAERRHADLIPYPGDR